MFWKKTKSKTRDFFVSIGAGLNQIPLIIEARNMGFQVIGVDKDSAAPGFYHCDLKIQESIEDYENIYIKLREMMFDGNISAIMTKSYGNAIITSAYLCEKFKVPSIPFEESKKFLSKKTTRKIYSDKGIKLPDSAKLKSKNLASQFPVVAKPQKGHAKADVKLLHNESEFKKFLKNHEKSDFIFEKFIPGSEIICAGLIEDGKYYHILMSDKKTTPHPFFVDLTHSTPSKYIHLTDNTIEIGQMIADTFNIHTSPLIMEFIVDENEELYLLEAVPEFGGEFIPDVMVPAATGYNHLGGAIKAMTGDSPKKPSKGAIPAPVVVKYITGDNGVLSSCSTDAVKLMPDVLFTRIFKTIGSRIKSPEMNHDRIGVIAAKGKTLEQAMETALTAEEKMNIRIKPDD
jgi:biotin carboxylase